MNQLAFIVLPGEYAMCRLSAQSDVPSFPWESSFCTVSKTPDEVSIICEASAVPEGINCNKGWRLLKINAVLDLSLTGITAKFSTALADAGINLCVIATHDTDYILVKEEKLADAVIALRQTGFIVEP
ncbi:MAG: ACT domain-containing protein [Chitinophagaceae bacterium]|nr:ACT domain-containing protein [Chitinophagaceae bacterium]